jgi:hypothetical protein
LPKAIRSVDKPFNQEQAFGTLRRMLVEVGGTAVS